MFLEIPSNEVQIPFETGTRKFRLVQMKIRPAAAFLRRLDEAVSKERESIGDDRTFEQIVDASSDLVEHLLVEILSPIDDGPRMTVEEAVELVLDQRTAILEAQMKLNRADDLVGKMTAIVMEIQAIRLARAITSLTDGLESSPLSLHGATIPNESPTSGPSPKLSTATDGSAEISGGMQSEPADLPDVSPNPSPTLA